MSSGPVSHLTGTGTDRVGASTTIDATPEAVFAVLADPSAHADIDGTGWVRASLDGARITAAGQVFGMAMYHPNHPDRDYKIANRVAVFDEPRAIAAAGHGVARDRGAELRRLDLAVRPPGDGLVTDDGDADLRLVRGPAPHPRVPPVPAVRGGPSRQLAAALVRPRPLGVASLTPASSRGHLGRTFPARVQLGQPLGTTALSG